MKPKALIFFLFLFSVSVSLSSQTLRVIRTRHVDLVYEERLEDLALELSARVDETYKRLVETFGAEPYSRLKVYLIDRDELANAYADPISNVIVIYPNELFVRDFLPKYKSWVEYAFVHELTHILVGTSRILPSPMTNLVHSTLVPLYLQEGLAILFESEEGFGRLNDPIFRTNMEMTKGVSVGFSASPRVFPGGGPYVLGARFVEETVREFGREEFMSFVKDYLRRPRDGFARVYSEHFGKQSFPISSKRFTVLMNPKVLNGDLYYLRVDDFEEGIFKHGEGFVVKESVLDYAFFEGKVLRVRFVTTVEGVWTGLFDGEKLFEKHVIRVNSFGDDLVGVVRRTGGVNDVVDLKGGKVIFKGERDFNPLDATPWKDGVYFIARKNGDVDLFCVREGKVYRVTEDPQVEFNLFSTEEGVYFVKEDEGRTVLMKIDGGSLETFEADGNVIGGTEWVCVVQRSEGFAVEALKLSRRENLSLQEVVTEDGGKAEIPQAQDHRNVVLPRLVLVTPLGSSLVAWDDLLEKGFFFVASPWLSSFGFFFERNVQLLFGVTLFEGELDTFYSLRLPILVGSKQAKLVLEGTDGQTSLKLSVGGVGGRRHSMSSVPEYEITVLPELTLSCGFEAGRVLSKFTFSPRGFGTEVRWPIGDLNVGVWDGGFVLDSLDGVVRLWLGEETELQAGVMLTTVVGYNSVLPIELLLSWRKGGFSLMLSFGRLTF